MAAALGPSLHEHDHRHLGGDHPAGGAGRARERAGDPRVPLHRGGARARRRATCASPSATSCPTRSAPSSCSSPPSSAAPSSPRPRCRSSASACPSPIPSWGRMLSIVGRGVRAEGAVAGDLPGHRDQPGGVRHQPARRRPPRHPGSAAARQLEAAVPLFRGAPRLRRGARASGGLGGPAARPWPHRSEVSHEDVRGRAVDRQAAEDRGTQPVRRHGDRHRAAGGAGDIERALQSAERGARTMAKLLGLRALADPPEGRRADGRAHRGARADHHEGRGQDPRRGPCSRRRARRRNDRASAEEAKRLRGETCCRSTARRAAPASSASRSACRAAWWSPSRPFNFPLNLVCHKVGPALAAGNAVILKPASDTPLSALKLVEILLEAGLPPRASPA